MNLNFDLQLIDAARKNDIDGVRKSLDAGANVNAVNKDYFDAYEDIETSKMTALHFAVDNNNLEMVRLLRSRGADRSLINGDCYTAKQHAAETNYVSICSLL